MSDIKELSQINKSFGLVRMGLEGRLEFNNCVYELEQIAIQFNLWRNETAEMQAAIVELREALEGAKQILGCIKMDAFNEGQWVTLGKIPDPAINAREDIKAMRDENKRLREALEEICDNAWLKIGRGHRRLDALIAAVPEEEKP